MTQGFIDSLSIGLVSHVRMGFEAPGWRKRENVVIKIVRF